MRQAVVLLTIVAIALLAITCCVVTGSIEQSQQLERRQQLLLEAKRSLSDLQSEHELLTLEKDGLSAKLEQLNEQLASFTIDHDAMQTALDDAQTNAKMREDELTKQALARTDAQAAYEEQIAQLQAELNEQQAMCVSLGNQQAQALRERDDLQARLTAQAEEHADALAAEQAKLTAQSIKAADELAALQTQLSTQQDEHAAALSALQAQLATQTDEHAAALGALQSKLDTAEVALATAGDLRAENEAAIKQIGALTAELAEKHAEHATYMRAVEAVRAYRAGKTPIAGPRQAIADFHAAYPDSELSFEVENP